MNSNFISVLMTTYNCAPYIGMAIRSILNQSYKDFEFLIIDDGSTDNTAEIMDRYDDKRIRYIKRNHLGRSSALNFGLKIASYDTIALMDADDISIENRFERQCNFLINNSDIQIVGSNIEYINEEGVAVGEKKYPELQDDIEFMMPIESAICHPATMMRREIIDNSGSYNLEYGYAADHALFLNLLKNGYNFYNLQEILLKYRFPVLRKRISWAGNSDIISYNIGVEYLNNILSTNASSEEKYSFNFRMGLIEYYQGDITVSRKYLLKAISHSKRKALIIMRYVLVTLLGHKLISFLRRKNYLPIISFYINKITGFDLHRIRG